MIISTDDLAPQHMEMFMRTWDELYKRHPNMKLIAFTTLMWHGKEDQAIHKNEDFMEFCNERKEWLILAMHGFHHIKAEGLLTEEYWLPDLANIWRDFKPECGVLNAYKPPFYKWNLKTLENASKAGIRYFFVQDGFLDLESHQFYDRTSSALIDSHTNPMTDMPDRIDKIFDDLDNSLKNATTSRLF